MILQPPRSNPLNDPDVDGNTFAWMQDQLRERQAKHDADDYIEDED